MAHHFDSPGHIEPIWKRFVDEFITNNNTHNVTATLSFFKDQSQLLYKGLGRHKGTDYCIVVAFDHQPTLQEVDAFPKQYNGVCLLFGVVPPLLSLRAPPTTLEPVEVLKDDYKPAQ